MSSGPNPPLENVPPAPALQSTAPVPPQSAPAENPVWGGWDVLFIATVTIFIVMLLVPGIAVFLAKKFLYHGVPLTEIAQKPWLGLTAEFVGYLLLFVFIVMFIEGRYQVSFLQAIRWNWPSQTWLLFAGFGIVLLIAIQVLGHFLPMPKEVPLDKFFQSARDAYLTSIFAISFGPFMEELLFRGILYPVLARRTGMIASIVITGTLFGLIHGLQLSFAWGPVLLIILVGIALTIIRAISKSVGASLIVHIAYNSTLTVLSYIQTDGFRHLERLKQ